MRKELEFKVNGLNRDLSPSVFPNNKLYDAKNIRITVLQENTLLDISNEKGNKEVYIKNIGNYVRGIPIGEASIDNILIIFSKGKNNDSVIADISSSEVEDIPISSSLVSNIVSEYDDTIYKITFDPEIKGEILYSGNLNFKETNIIESTFYYNNIGDIKLYWVDGVNQPRFINIMADEEEKSTWSNTSFNFAGKLTSIPNIDIKKYNSGGEFPSGTIQYCFTYFNTNSRESPPFYVSPLYYLSEEDRGLSSEDTSNNSFKISIEIADRTWDYIRIYSIIRTSDNSTPVAKKVADLKIRDEYEEVGNSVTYTASPSNIFLSYYSDFKEQVILKDIREDGGDDTSVSWDTSIEKYNYLKIVHNSTSTILNITNVPIRIISYSNGNSTIATIDGSMIKKVIPSTTYYIDTGIYGSDIDSSQLLYTGGQYLVAGTINQKDETLFLGNLIHNAGEVSFSLKSILKNNMQDIQESVSNEDDASYKEIILPQTDSTKFYMYENSLNESSYKNRIFKGGEYYRFGIQLQDKYGNWSDPIYLQDVKNRIYPSSGTISSNIVKVWRPKSVIKAEAVNACLNEGWIRVRPIVVYPQEGERTVLMQGILNPTLFNTEDRQNNTPYAISSWFFRPTVPFDIDNCEQFKKFSWSTSIIKETEDTSQWKDLTVSDIDNSVEGSDKIPLVYSRQGILSNDLNNCISIAEQRHAFAKSLISKGTWVECRPFQGLAGGNTVDSYITRAAEIQASANAGKFWNFTGEDIALDPTQFGCDTSLLTFHSPDIEFKDFSNIPNGYKLRLVGVVPITSSSSYTTLTSSTAPMDNTIFPYYIYNSASSVQETRNIEFGYYGNNLSAKTGIDPFGFKGVCTQASYRDGVVNYTDVNSGAMQGEGASFGGVLYAVFPWHNISSYNNSWYEINGWQPSKTSKKYLSNIRYSYNNYYFTLVDKSTNNNSLNFDNITYDLFKEEDGAPLVINGNLYYGNYDKVVTPLSYYEAFGAPMGSIGRFGGPKVANFGLPTLYNNYNEFTWNPLENIQNDCLDTNGYSKFYSGGENSYQEHISSPSYIRGKSTSHIVVDLNDSDQIKVLPTIEDYPFSDTGLSLGAKLPINRVIQSNMFEEVPGKVCQSLMGKTKVMSQNIVSVDFSNWNELNNVLSIGYGFMWLAELYRDINSYDDLFGGNSDSAIEMNTWLPCGDIKELKRDTDIDIYWEEGDTYYQRYDCLKTYPYTEEEKDSVIDILSFMCETRLNIDGRYDRNRGKENNTAMRPSNFNLYNPSYSQSNNFFSYTAINPDRSYEPQMPNSITWSLAKTSGDLTDSWVNLNLANILNLDGALGEITKISRFNNELIAFQPKGISNILFNQRVQIPTSDSTPIEITNSDRVSGKRYISEYIGSSNKASILETPSGIYFVDDYGSNIYLFQGKLTNLSESLGIKSWISKLDSNNVWYPETKETSIRTLYDKTIGEVYFIMGEECLAYNELLNIFTSFYDYDTVTFMDTINGRCMGIAKDSTNYYKLWEQHEGEYNMFMDEFKPFYITYIAAPEPTKNKIFGNIEYRADCFDSTNSLTEETFDTFEIWNEYQRGDLNLNNIKDHVSNLKRKFRIWRVTIPRDTNNKLDRIQNMWAAFKFEKSKVNTNKFILHDLKLYYYV